jgi:hypothetical protein
MSVLIGFCMYVGASFDHGMISMSNPLVFVLLITSLVAFGTGGVGIWRTRRNSKARGNCELGILLGLIVSLLAAVVLYIRFSGVGPYL